MKSSDNSDGSATHESFPVHGLTDERAYQRRASGLLRGDVEDGESVCSFEADIHESSKAGLQKTVEALQCKDIKGGKLVLRPYLDGRCWLYLLGLLITYVISRMLKLAWLNLAEHLGHLVSPTS